MKLILNLRTKTLHRRPSTERCNLDQVPRKYKRYIGIRTGNNDDLMVWAKHRHCGHCLK